MLCPLNTGTNSSTSAAGEYFTEKRPSTTARLLEEEQKELDKSLPAATINALKHAKVGKCAQAR
jgi:hypothetical protein